MAHDNFLGGVWRRGDGPQPEAVREQWGWVGGHTELFARGSACSRLYTWDGLALLIRGYARPSNTTRPLDLGRVAQELRRDYLLTGRLAVEGLDGAFTLALLDSRAESVILYRNIAGAGTTYYRATGDGLLFAGNLAELVDVSKIDVRPNRAVLPDFFLFRCVPGRDTLFEGLHRLMPGEEVTWTREGGVSRKQRHTFADLMGVPVRPTEAIERTDAVMAAVLRDVTSLRDSTANLLSGGVDSSYIQAVYNQEVHRSEEMPVSYSVSVDHPMTWIDTDYAITASFAVGTRHHLVPADGPYRDYLLDALATTAEPINHVQGAYFGHLARHMANDGVRAGLCGEGADSLFGLGLANRLHSANAVETWLPIPFLRPVAASMCGLLGRSDIAAAIRLAGRTRMLASTDHPINQVAVFTDLPAAVESFGPDAVEAAFARRRGLADTYRVPDEPMDRLHAVGLLGEAIDTAGLWTTMFQRAGVDLHCPFLDSRILRVSLSMPAEVRYRFRRPKDVLKRALARRAPREIATRVKLGFAQPVFEWLAPGGQLAPLLARVGEYGFRPPTGLREKPTWFSYGLLCYDQWHRLFVERSLPRPAGHPALKGRANSQRPVNGPQTPGSLLQPGLPGFGY
jgi:asparagine synthase (glutamine-hydrolysing)